MRPAVKPANWMKARVLSTPLSLQLLLTGAFGGRRDARRDRQSRPVGLRRLFIADIHVAPQGAVFGLRANIEGHQRAVLEGDIDVSVLS